MTVGASVMAGGVSDGWRRQWRLGASVMAGASMMAGGVSGGWGALVTADGVNGGWGRQ